MQEAFRSVVVPEHKSWTTGIPKTRGVFRGWLESVPRARGKESGSSVKAAVHLTSGRLLARNTVWNLLGQILPMTVGLVAIPILVRGIGVARFGVLSLASVLIGYFSLFDRGIGRALTKLVAEK